MSEKVVLDRDDLRRTLLRIAHEIVETNPEAERLALVGIHTARRGHGPPPARPDRRADRGRYPLGDLDISFYRDDVGARSRPATQPVVHSSHIDFDLDGRTVVLVDDVLFTGRTVRAAIDALFDYGRPQRVQLAVLCDRGHRELPIRPDYVGKNLPTARAERVNVRLEETDGVDEVTISEPRAAEAMRMKHLLGDRGPGPRGDRGDPRPRRELRRGRPAATSRRCRRCAGARSSTSSTSRARAPAPPSSSPPSGSPPTWSSLKAAGSSVDKGESLKDTVRDPLRLRPGGDRDPPPLRRRRAAGRRAGARRR